MPTPLPDPTTLHCPRCGAANLRQSRRQRRADAGPEGAADASAGRRWRCHAPACAWRGSLAPQRRQAWVRLATAAGPARRAALGLGLLAAVAVTGGVMVVAGLETWARQATGLDLAQGRSHDGLPLGRASTPQGGQLLRAQATADKPAADRAASAGLNLRQGCAWGQPGRNPYRGSTEQALTAAGLPPEVVRQISAQRKSGHKVGRLTISRETIRLDDGAREFSPRQMAMSFGNTLCLNTRVNFAPGHVEAADLFEAHDEQGRLHTVMVPDVCGNVTVLGARRPGGVVAGVSAALADRSQALVALADALAAAASDRRPPALGGAGTAGGSHPGPDDAAAPGLAARYGPGAAEATTRPGDGDGEAPTAGTPHAPTLAAGPGGSSGSNGSPGDGGAGRAGEPAGAQRDGRVTPWLASGAGGLPSTLLIAGLNGSASVLAKAGTTIASLPVPGGERGTDRLSTRQNTSDPRSIPEPGTLLCVLAGLAGLAWVGRRGG